MEIFVDPEKMEHVCYDITRHTAIRECQFNLIVAITKGGLVPAYYLARSLDIKDIRTICLSSYNGMTRGQIVEHSVPDLKGQQYNILIVDDLVDSGETMKYAVDTIRNSVIQNGFPATQIKTVALYKKSQSSFTPDFYHSEVDNATRIKFFYE